MAVRHGLNAAVFAVARAVSRAQPSASIVSIGDSCSGTTKAISFSADSIFGWNG
jgi:hypothetical protein